MLRPILAVDAINQLRAFEAVFRVSCQQRGAPLYRPLLQQLQQLVEDGGGTPLQEVGA